MIKGQKPAGRFYSLVATGKLYYMIELLLVKLDRGISATIIVIFGLVLKDINCRWWLPSINAQLSILMFKIKCFTDILLNWLRLLPGHPDGPLVLGHGLRMEREARKLFLLNPSVHRLRSAHVVG